MIWYANFGCSEPDHRPVRLSSGLQCSTRIHEHGFLGRTHACKHLLTDNAEICGQSVPYLLHYVTAQYNILLTTLALHATGAGASQRSAAERRSTSVLRGSVSTLEPLRQEQKTPRSGSMTARTTSSGAVTARGWMTARDTSGDGWG